jgi:hypothetical protein
MRHSIKPIIRDDKPVKRNGKYPIYYLVRFTDLQIKIPSCYDVEKKYLILFFDTKASPSKLKELL